MRAEWLIREEDLNYYERAIMMARFGSMTLTLHIRVPSSIYRLYEKAIGSLETNLSREPLASGIRAIMIAGLTDSTGTVNTEHNRFSIETPTDELHILLESMDGTGHQKSKQP